MREIEKKVWPEYFEKLLSGEKNFEVRLADWECDMGDILILKEFDPEKKQYTGRELRKEITYIAKTKNMKFFTKEEIEEYGYQILGLK